jgi:PadR family transcriptional regulator, regulatory protein PadR
MPARLLPNVGCRSEFLPACLTPTWVLPYIALQYMASSMFDRELKKGSADLLILSLLEIRPRHGYEISKVIEERSGGTLSFNVASLYPLLYRLEKRGWIAGRWVEKAGQRRRRYYRLTAEGRKILRSHRSAWLDFVAAINRIAGLENA